MATSIMKRQQQQQQRAAVGSGGGGCSNKGQQQQQRVQAQKKELSVRLPVLVLIIKNINKLFSFEVQILDSKKIKRRFRVSNFQKETRIKPYLCAMPLRMDSGWVYIHLNLADLTRKAFGTHYVHTSRVQVHANCRINRIFFSEHPFREELLPEDLRLPLSDLKS